MSENRRLVVQLLDFWHCGTGKGSGEYLDALVDRDSDRLPFVPGKMLKGLLRDAVGLCEAWNHVPRNSQCILFGSDAFDRDERQPAQPAEPGTLWVSSARLPEDLAHWLRKSPGPRQALFRDLFATAVDPETGAAVNRSLRGMEVAVPLRLEAEIGPLPERNPPADWQTTLKTALPLVRAVGHQRSRGLGRCVIEFAEES
jgi:hypothetical protein